MNQSLASHGGTIPSQVVPVFKEAAWAAITEFLAFKLGAEEYGIDILQVQEIRSCEAPTRFANTPALIKGVINLRV